MLTVALAGNPNSGKTTLFNALTGSRARVGNWAGVTVEKKEGFCEVEGEQVRVIDLPGLYSLAPYSLEERLARNVLLEEKPDVIVHIVDATNLERSLYLTTQLLELDVPVVVALNMTDVLDKRGDSINVRELERRLGLPVVEISARNGEHINLLLTRVVQTAKTPRKGRSVLQGLSVYPAVEYAENLLIGKGAEMALFHAIKLVEGDTLTAVAYPSEQMAIREYLERQYPNIDTEAIIADGRYREITARFSPTLTKSKGAGKTYSEKADRWLTHKWLGIPIFVAVLFLVFHAVFSDDVFFLSKLIPAFRRWCEKDGNVVKKIFFGEGLNSLGVTASNALSASTAVLAEWTGAVLIRVGANAFIVGLICDGVLGGLFSVLGFLPQILLLFFLFSILEDSGYMARVAFMLDRIFRPFGISGRAFMPMIMGMGCSVPAILNTRTLATEKERIATVRVTPFFPCGAKMPVVLTVAGAIVKWNGLGFADILVGCTYVLCIIVAMLSLLVMHKLSPSDGSPFIMELPSYRMPSGKSTAFLLWEKTKHFLQKAFTVITLSGLAVWLFTNLSWEWKYVDDTQNSILVSVGKFLSPFFAPLGFGQSPYGWVFAVATLTGLIAKENVVVTLGALAGCLCEVGDDPIATLFAFTGVRMPAVLAFVVFNMLTLPCVATLITARAELGGKEMRKAVALWLGVSYTVSLAVYTIALTAWAWLVWMAVVCGAWFGLIFFTKRKPSLRIRSHTCERCKRCKR